MTLTPKRFLTYVAILFLSMALLALVELFSPLRPPGKDRRRRTQVNLTLTVLVFAMNALLSAGATAAGLTVSPTGILEGLVPSLPARIFIGIAILDLFTYVAHVSMHKVPLLWRLHRVHHCDPFVDVTTTYRFHPLEALWRFSWTLGPVLLFGVPAQGIVAYQFLSALNGLFEHANFSIGSALDRVLSWLWVTPNMHKVHHSTECPETNSNYGNLFAVYDRVFQTFTPTGRALGVTYGLRNIDPERATSLAGALTLPFDASRRATDLSPKQEVSS
jgi:sterol desaturase/sphingolipid hydroxylase (fatty acid hydroxylase superfamily)